MKDELRKIPGIDKLIKIPEIVGLEKCHGNELVRFCLREVIDHIRLSVLSGGKAPESEEIIVLVRDRIEALVNSTLKPVINATGIVLHTNLARAPLGKNVLEKLTPFITGYSNLEFNLATGRRGHRNDHISKLIEYVTGAESAVVVNNNAAAVLLLLKTFAEGGEVIVSRGELIEIGGSFRIPDIMDSSGSKMIEVGTTNRTRIADYENAITENTKVLFKAHKSNYYIGGFTEEAELEELSALAKKHNLLFIYDMGSGLLRKPEKLDLAGEPDVKSALKAGCDLISFSGDKLLGGPQAGIICGRKDLVSKLAKAPLMRALRVGKLTIAALATVISSYFRDEDLINDVPIFKLLNRNKTDLENLGSTLIHQLSKYNLKSELIPSLTQVGGGTLPHLKVKSLAVKLYVPSETSGKDIFLKLLKLPKPVLAVLREGDLIFDMMTLFEHDLEYIASAVNSCIAKE